MLASEKQRLSLGSHPNKLHGFARPAFFGCSLSRPYDFKLEMNESLAPLRETVFQIFGSDESKDRGSNISSNGRTQQIGTRRLTLLATSQNWTVNTSV